MIPLPIALIAVFYAFVTAVSTVVVWRVLIGASTQLVVWPLAWTAVSVTAMYGLALLRPWGRAAAVWGFFGLTLMTIGASAGLIVVGEPGWGLLVTFTTVLYVLGIRYLRRPVVKALFVGH